MTMPERNHIVSSDSPTPSHRCRNTTPRFTKAAGRRDERRVLSRPGAGGIMGGELESERFAYECNGKGVTV